MTYQDALRIISKDHIVTIYHDEDVSQKVWREAIQIAKEAVALQVPVVPVSFGFKSECPRCMHKVYDDMNFCSCCGKALDWRRPI